MSPVVVRAERPEDHASIAAVITAAFEGHPHSQGQEASIVARLRRRHALVVGLVAVEQDGAVVGHAAFSRVILSRTGGGWYALGPLAVRPDRWRRGIGKGLIAAGLTELRVLGASGCVVLGDPGYYGRLGFSTAGGLSFQDVPSDHLMAVGFTPDPPKGEVAFHSAFFETE